MPIDRIITHRTSLAKAAEGRRNFPGLLHGSDADTIARVTPIYTALGIPLLADSRAATSCPPLTIRTEGGQAAGGHTYRRVRHMDASGRTLLEQWTIHGSGHAWSGGHLVGSYTDPKGPQATHELLRFFLAHRKVKPAAMPD